MGSLQTEKWSVIIPSLHSEVLTRICIRSFEAFRPDWLQLEYVVVENSNDENYVEDLPNVRWISNPSSMKGSEDNALALEKGLHEVETEWVFMAHCDVCVTSPLFFSELKKKQEDGYEAIGMLRDKHPDRIQALHILGLLVKKNIIEDINLFPRYKGGKQILDVGDSITERCRNEEIPHYCFRNTYNDPEIIPELNERYRDLILPRCVAEDGTVIYLHLSRGIGKLDGSYKKSNRVYVNEWKCLCEEIINEG